jgi:hypothetical protein
MKPYVVTIARSNHTTTQLELYAKDRKDAIEYAKRTHRARFWSGEYKRVVSARQGWKTPESIKAAHAFLDRVDKEEFAATFTEGAKHAAA